MIGGHSWPTPRPLDIDPCPTCGARVIRVDGTERNGAHIARPCAHRVTVTVWPNRIELTEGNRT